MLFFPLKQQALAFAPVSENETVLILNCPISMSLNESQMNMGKQTALTFLFVMYLLFYLANN